MNKYQTILTLSLATIIATPAINADSGNNSNPDKIILVPGKSDPNRHRIPARTFLTCTYQNGELTFDIPADVEFLSVTVRHDATDQIWYNVVDEQFPTMEIGTLSGSYTITVITDADSEFTGTFTL